MIELTALLESGVEHSPGHPVAAEASYQPTVDSNDWIRRVTNEQTNGVQQVVVTSSFLNNNLTSSVLDDNRKSSGLDENTLPPSTSIEPADTNGTKVFELMTANLNATLKYVQRLVDVTSAEFVESSSDHVRRHLGLMVEYTNAFSQLSRQLMTSTIGTAGHVRDEKRQP
jgi:uncharacterized glyoxalase superfamily metalloenzyme YdcJ